MSENVFLFQNTKLNYINFVLTHFFKTLFSDLRLSKNVFLLKNKKQNVRLTAFFKYVYFLIVQKCVLFKTTKHNYNSVHLTACFSPTMATPTPHSAAPGTTSPPAGGSATLTSATKTITSPSSTAAK